MDGGAVFRFATSVMVDSTRRVLDVCGLGIDDVDWIVPHQANVRIIDNAVKRLGADPARVLVNLERYGNTSAASIPLCLEEAWSDGRLKKGDRVLMVGFGGGLTWGSCLTEWAAAQGREGRRMTKVAFLFPGPGLAGGRHGRRRSPRPPRPRGAAYDARLGRARVRRRGGLLRAARSSGCRRPR